MSGIKVIFAVLYSYLCMLSVYSAEELKRKQDVNNDICIITVDNTVINLNDLRSENGYEVHADSRIFILNICGDTFACKENVAVCEIDSKTKRMKHILGYSDTLSYLTSYKPIPGLKYQTHGRKKYRVEIEFKCNRHLRTHNVTYIRPQGEVGRRYKFIFASNFFCIRREMNCLLRDEQDNSMYDLNPLHKASGNWHVGNTTDQAKIYLNICGPLNQIEGATDRQCSYHGTHVCLVNNRGVTKNLGVYSAKIDLHDHISITFSDGTSCDGSKNTETRIDFFCSFQEQGPVLSLFSSCKYYLIWNTPKACPHHVSVGTGCQIYDYFLGFLDISSLFSITDKKKQISNKIISYNICNTLFTPCGYYNNASVCVDSNGKKIVFGWTNPRLISKDGELTMDLYGEKCSSGAQRLTHIKFHCELSKNLPETISFSKNMCKMDINIYTKLVCIEPALNLTTCTVQADSGRLYDLQSLSSKSRNYEIQDPHNANLIYIINLCRPVLFNNNAMCDRYSSVCLRNNSEPNITKRYISLGNTLRFSQYAINSNLFFKYDHGSICKEPNVTHSSTSTEIQFICAKSSQQIKPILKESDGCNFKFLWKTHLVCST